MPIVFENLEVKGNKYVTTLLIAFDISLWKPFVAKMVDIYNVLNDDLQCCKMNMLLYNQMLQLVSIVVNKLVKMNISNGIIQ